MVQSSKPEYDPEKLTITNIDPHQVANYSLLGVDPTVSGKRVRWSGNSWRNFWQQDIYTALSSYTLVISELRDEIEELKARVAELESGNPPDTISYLTTYSGGRMETYSGGFLVIN